MSSKFIYKMSDENPDLRKQIGCMNGIFQLFERHHFLGGTKRINAHNHNRLPPAGNGNREAEDKNAAPKTTEKDHKKTVKEKQRNSTESSRTSFSSSSCSSSFASVEYSKACQLEAPSSGLGIAPETQALEASFHRSPASVSSCQSLDLRDVVKGSIYRESQGLSIRTPAKGEVYGKTLKYVDSPRPFQSTKSVNSRNSGLKESFQVPHKLKESTKKSNEKNETLTSPVKDARRFSCDGRESRATLKSNTRLKELPRLSLDSKAPSIRGSGGMKSSSIFVQSSIGNENKNNSLDQQDELGSCKRASSVVARLMGLEALPDSVSTNTNETLPFDAPSHGSMDANVRLLRTIHEDKLRQFPSYPRYQQKEPPTSPCPTNSSTRKPTASSKFPMEPAPWKQLDGNRSSQIEASKNMVTTIKPSKSLSVYGEIEKRLEQLEFKRSGKDLRALKQILEAMQKTKEVLETRNEATNYETRTSSSSSSSIDQRTKIQDPQSTPNDSPIYSIEKGNRSPRHLKSPIVIMKPTKLLGKAEKTDSSGNLTESPPGLRRLRTSDSTDGRKEAFRNARDTTPRPNPAIYSGQSPRSTSKSGISKRFPQTSKESTFSSRASETSCESSGTINRKQYQNRLVLDKQHHPSSMPPDSNRTRKQSSKQPTHSGSPRGKPRAKPSKSSRSDDELSDISTEVRHLYHQSDEISLQSDSNISFGSQIDEVSSTDRSKRIDGPLSELLDWKRKNPAESSCTEKVVAEQPSPVSVLDATFYNEELPSPIKKKSVAFKDDEAPIPDDMEWNPSNPNYSTHGINTSVNSMIDHKKGEVIQYLVQNVRHLLSAREGAINHETTSYYDSTNPDHRYISDLLTLSGMVKDFESRFTTINLHPTGCPIDPNWFTVLEQAKVTTEHVDDHSGISTIQSGAQVTSRRKLLFDVVNEILLHRLLSERSSRDTTSPNMIGNRTSQRQHLLQELCSAVDRLQCIDSNCCLAEEGDYIKDMIRVDLMHQSSNWTAYRSDTSRLVLDVERLIFKDLICEIVADETYGIQSAGYQRQLFSK